MHPDLEKLLLLQQHDVEARRLRDELTALPKLVAELTARAKATEGQRAHILELLGKEEVLRRREELDVKTHQTKIAHVRKQLDQAISTTQVTAFEHEISFAQQQVSQLEDAELESLERTDAFESQRVQADAAVAEAAEILARERARATETIAHDKVLLAAVEAQRAALRPQIDEAALANYDRIARGKGTAIAEAVNQKCMACQMMIRPQRWNDLRERDNNDTMMTCESCGRLLFYDPARDAPQRKTVPVESIAASIVRSL